MAMLDFEGCLGTVSPRVTGVVVTLENAPFDRRLHRVRQKLQGPPLQIARAAPQIARALPQEKCSKGVPIRDKSQHFQGRKTAQFPVQIIEKAEFTPLFSDACRQASSFQVFTFKYLKTSNLRGN
jgi:hypothetical protein